MTASTRQPRLPGDPEAPSFRAGRVHSGLIINGIAVPEALSEKISGMATMNLLQYIEAAMDMRHAGMEEAMNGNWDVARLSA